jgi:uncharacterized membrane protein
MTKRGCRKNALASNDCSQEVQESSPHVNKACLVFLLLCSSFFALYKSNSAFTSDEVWTVKVASMNYSSHMAALKSDVHPPLYYQFLYAWVRLFGSGEQTVRSLSGLFYVLSVYAVYGLGRDLYGSKGALLSATIYMSSPLAILSAQFARMYALLSLLSVLSTWLYLQFSVKPRESRLAFTAYVLVNVLGTFTHISFFFVLFGHVVFLFLFYRQARIKRFLFAITLSFIPYLVIWAPVLLGQVAKSQQGLAWINKPGLSTYAELFIVYGGAFWLLLPVLLYLWWRNGSQPLSHVSLLQLKSLPLWLLIITILTPLLISQIKPVFNSRLAIVGLHLFALTIASIIGSRANYFLSFELIVLTAIGLVLLHPGFASCDNRAIAAYLSKTTNNGDIVIFTSLTRLPIDYYLERGQRRKELFETSFPSEIDLHPGYEGDITNPNRRSELEREAQELVDKITNTQLSTPGRKVMLLHGFHPDVDSIIEKRLQEKFQLDHGQGIECSETSPYFKEVSVYR